MTGETDPFVGWSFATDEFGNAHVRSPTGLARIYSQQIVAETLVQLVEQAHSAPDTLSDYTVDYWRRVVGEARWADAMRVLAEVAPI